MTGARSQVIFYTIAALIALAGLADATYLTVTHLTGEVCYRRWNSDGSLRRSGLLRCFQLSPARRFWLHARPNFSDAFRGGDVWRDRVAALRAGIHTACVLPFLPVIGCAHVFSRRHHCCHSFHHAAAGRRRVHHAVAEERRNMQSGLRKSAKGLRNAFLEGGSMPVIEIVPQPACISGPKLPMVSLRLRTSRREIDQSWNFGSPEARQLVRSYSLSDGLETRCSPAPGLTFGIIPILPRPASPVRVLPRCNPA